jgi:hypothetical protein
VAHLTRALLTRELIDRALETMHSFREDREEAIHNPMPLFGINLLGEIHGSLDVGEEDGHLLPFAFEGAAGGEDFLGEVLGCVCAGRLRG